MSRTMLFPRSDEASSSTEPPPPASPVRESGWADGLRGIAAVFVVSSHTVLSFARHVVIPSDGENGPVVLWQRPFFRLIGQGRAFVAIFFILMGYVNSLKPLKKARAGNKDEALSDLARASFNRTGRLVLPATAVTVITWFVCQIGFFDMAANSSAYWLRTTSHGKNASWGWAVLDLGREIIDTWFYAENKYDQPQWALLYLLKGSMYVFMALLATVNVRNSFRLAVYIGLYMWCWGIGECLVGINIFAGMILAEFSLLSIHLPSHRFIRALPFLAVVLALYLMSFPDEYPDWALWSRQLNTLGKFIFPTDAEQGRFWPGIGAQILCFSVMLSPTMRKVFSHPYLLYLGKISFSLYLLHGPLMRSVLAWLTFTLVSLNWKPNLKQDGELDGTQWIPLPRPLWFVIILPVFWVFMFWVVHLWSVKVEPHFGKVISRLEEFACGEDGGVLPAQKERMENRLA